MPETNTQGARGSWTPTGKALGQASKAFWSAFWILQMKTRGPEKSLSTPKVWFHSRGRSPNSYSNPLPTIYHKSQIFLCWIYWVSLCSGKILTNLTGREEGRKERRKERGRHGSPNYVIHVPISSSMKVENSHKTKLHSFYFTIASFNDTC